MGDEKIMTKKELIKAMESFGDDEVVTIGDPETGWSNIGEVKIKWKYHIHNARYVKTFFWRLNNDIFNCY
jgi:hypothetical protein